ncbi:hypothetical protein WBJ53_15510 [Spirosoma sp. SC4-14]|uniref:hypothetical protein n=1 Tax=Spirosoma sp. SC4-14 TaxID=3128900 RepID=UPI0030CE7A57
MNIRDRFEKDPIELLLGMSGAVQYLNHSQKDEVTYWVWVKTKTGTKQIMVPIDAVRSIQSKKPDPAVILSIKNQLAEQLPGEVIQVHNLAEESKPPLIRFKDQLLRILGFR